MSDPNNGPVNGPTDPVDPPSTPPPAAPAGAPAPPTAPPMAPPVGSGYSQPGGSQPGGYGQPGGSQPGGYGQPTYAQAGPPAAVKTLSLIGMIAGIVGLLGAAVVAIPIVGSILGLFIPAAAVVLGFLGKKREGAPAKAFWLTAIITGAVGIGIALIAIIGYILLFAFAGSNNGYYY